MIVSAQAWSAIVTATGSNGGHIECVDEGAARYAERNVNTRNVGLARRNPEVRFRRHTETGDVAVTGLRGGQLHEQFVAGWRECTSIERLTLPESLTVNPV